MFKVDITEEVKKKRKESKEESFDAVQEAQLLLGGDEQKEREILKKIGLGHQIKKAEVTNTIDLERKTFEAEYDGEIIMTETEIKSLCVDYDLKFLGTKHYKGHTDLNIGPKIRNFIEKNNISPSANDFYIMAPPKVFNLTDRPKPVKDLDPVLFYKVPEYTVDNMYVMVHKWGKDFTILRYLKGLVKENWWSYSLFNLTIGVSLSLLFINILKHDYSISTGNIVGAFFIGLIYTAILTGLKIKEGEDANSRFNVNMWNSPFKK